MCLVTSHATVCRSSVMMVCGTGLNTPRSPSVMRSTSIGWWWTATAVTPVMRSWLKRIRYGSQTGWCSVLRTATTTSTLHGTAASAMDGGIERAAQITSTKLPMLFGKCSARSTTWKPLACWWKWTNRHAAGESPCGSQHLQFVHLSAFTLLFLQISSRSAALLYLTTKFRPNRTTCSWLWRDGRPITYVPFLVRRKFAFAISSSDEFLVFICFCRSFIPLFISTNSTTML